MNTHVHVNHCLAKRHHISRGHHSSTKDISKAHDFLAFSRIHCMSIYESGFEGLLHKDYIMLLLLGPKDASTVILVPIKNVTPDEEPYQKILSDMHYGQRSNIVDEQLQLFLKSGYNEFGIE